MACARCNSFASIACSGVCLTVIDHGPRWFAVDVSAETLARTTLGGWDEGTAVNLERALCVGDELGGHLVTGHIDGVVAVAGAAEDGDSVRLALELPAWLAPFVAAKGSIALDGVSLTVNDVAERTFGINIIPHTQQRTTLGARIAGDRVNVEIDVLARYVRRTLAFSEGREPAWPR